MQIYVNGHLIQAQILPTNKPTKDETLETFSFALVNDQAKPYAPCQFVQVITDSNEKINLILTVDSVELFSSNPLKYKHNIICIQNTRKLSKHLVRNSVFSQPSNPIKESYNAATISLAHRQNDPQGAYKSETYGTYDLHSGLPSLNEVERKVELTYVDANIREKIKNAFVEIRCSAIKCAQGMEDVELPSGVPSEWVSPNTNQEIRNMTSNSTSWSFGETLYLYCEKDGGQSYTEAITPWDLGLDTAWFVLNKKFRCPRIMELASAGYTKFSLRFPDPITSFLSGTCYPYKDDFFLTISFQLIITLETYVYTAYDILDRLRIRQRKQRYEGINSVLVYEPDLFQLPNTEPLFSLLIKTPAPNFIFTQCTMYECIAEVFRLFDAIFTMDENNVLDIDYFNKLSGRDVTDSLKKVGENLAISEDKYTNGLVAYYQDGRTVETFPAGSEKTDDCYAPIRSKTVGVPLENSDFAFFTPHKIDNVQHCYVKFLNSSGQKIAITSDFSFGTGVGYVSVGSSDVNKLIGNPILDIAHWVVYEDLWCQLSSTNTMIANVSPFTRYQINTLSFAKGSNELKVSYSFTGYRDNDISKDLIPNKQFAFDNAVNCALYAMLGCYYGNSNFIVRDTLSDWRQIYLKVVYMTSVDGRVKIESPQRKYDGETLIDQYNGAVDLNKMGLNILGLSLKLGNPTLTVTQKITRWSHRIKAGDVYRYQNGLWIANVVSYTFLGNGMIQATIQFVQNFNALALRTRLLREKRMSNISGELTVKSEENIIEYSYVTVYASGSESHPTYPLNLRTEIALISEAFYTNIGSSLGVNFGKDAEDRNKFDAAIFQKSTGGYYYYIPLIKYGSGNSLCFEMSYEHPMVIGNQTLVSEDGNAWYYANYIKYFTNALKYTNDEGYLIGANLAITSSQNITIDRSFPAVTWTGLNPLLLMINYSCFKQPNEVFALNYQLCFLPYDSQKDIIGSEFINNNAFVNGNTRLPNDLIVYYGNESYSILDSRGKGNYEDVSSSTYNLDTNFMVRIVLTLQTNVVGQSFAVCDKNGNILFASNRGINGNTINIYFTTHNKRVDNKILEDL